MDAFDGSIIAPFTSTKRPFPDFDGSALPVGGFSVSTQVHSVSRRVQDEAKKWKDQNSLVR